MKRCKTFGQRFHSFGTVLFLLMLALPHNATAETAEICYDYGCQQKQTVTFTAEELAPLEVLMEYTQNAEEERGALGEAIGYLYRLAGLKTPIYRDKGGNFNDDRTQSGAMDCIDHSTTANQFLLLLARNGWLRFHHVEPPVSRGAILSIHWGARVIDNITNEEFIIDRWFFDHGHAAAVIPIDDWMNRKDPSPEN